MNLSIRPAHTRLKGRPPEPCPKAVHAAFASLVEALGLSKATDADTPERATRLWLDHLLAGQSADLEAALGEPMDSDACGPIVIEPMGFHLVCPHHLTVASGAASIAYVPCGRIVGFGRLAQLVSMATARVALQEDVAQDIAEALAHKLGAHAVAVRLRAEHLCHTVQYPRSHGAQATTWGLAGDPGTCGRLQALLG